MKKEESFSTFDHLRGEPSNIRFRSKDDFKYLEKIANRTILISFWIVVGGFLLLIFIGLFSFILLKGDPVGAFFKSKHSFVIGTAICYAIYILYSRTKYFQRNIVQLTPAFSMKHKFEKAEKNIIYGIETGRRKWVKRGMEYLEDLKENFSEMPEYRELLEKGDKWLKENEKGIHH